MRSPKVAVLLLVIALTMPVVFAGPDARGPRPEARGLIVIDTSRPLHTFDASTAFGATIDAHQHGETEQVFTRENIGQMLSIGFRPLSYRLMTELGGEAWHWNPRGTWSDPERQEGYWTSSSEPGEPIALSFGYRLPRRGNTLDQAQNDGYSRIDDGDLSTFWKSNPYLDEHFAGELHPQWILADLGSPQKVSSVRIAWGEPYAVEYRVQWWNDADPLEAPDIGDWIDFGGGSVTGGRGGDVTLHLEPAVTRFVRIVMSRSSHSSGPPSSDIRHRLGFAVRELWIGDLLRHGKTAATQSVIWVSSTDSWHRASDLDRDLEQLGFDAVFSTGLTRGLGMLTPVSLLYGTPEDSAAEIAYLRKRGHPVSLVEMGEEPDGQHVSPEDYAALYRQWANAIHRVDPSLRLGGPAFQSTNDYVAFWRDERHASTAWVTRLFDDLRAHGRLADLSFFSFEWYPFDDLCVPPQKQIERAPEMLRRVVGRWRREGLPDTIPWIATEYGYSSYPGQAEVEMYGPIVDAEFVALFLSLGGDAAYDYTYDPETLLRNMRCPTWGNLTPFVSDEQHRILFRLPAYWAGQMIATEWSRPSGKETIYRAAVHDREIGVYPLRRADGSWSILLINRSSRAKRVTLPFARRSRVTQYSPEQYGWQPNGEKGQPSRNRPPIHFNRGPRTEDRGLKLPAHSITVVRYAPGG